MDIQTKDGILLRGIPDGTPDDVIKTRIAKIRAEAAPAAPELEAPGALVKIGRGMMDFYQGANQKRLNWQYGNESPEAKQYTADVAEENRLYDKGRGDNGQTGFDGWRMAGNIATPASLLPMGAAGVGGRLALGAAQGGIQGYANFNEDNSATGNLLRAGIGATAGAAVNAAAPYVANAVAKGGQVVMNQVADKSSGMINSLVPEATIINNLKVTLQNQGIDFSKLGEAAQKSLLEDARKQLTSGTALSAEQLARKATINEVAGPDSALRGQVTRTPEDWTQMSNLQKIEANLPAVKEGTLSTITGRLDDQHAAMNQYARGIGDLVYGGRPVEARAGSGFQASEKTADAVHSAFKNLGEEVSGIYTTARESFGAQQKLPTEEFSKRVTSALMDFEDVMPSPVVNRLKEFGFDLTGKTKPAREFTVEEGDKLLKLLNKRYGSASPDVKAALDEVRGALKDSVFDLAKGNNESAQRFTDAWSAAAGRFRKFEPKPLATLVKGQANTATFLENSVMKGNPKDLASLRDVLVEQGGKEAWDDLRGQAWEAIVAKVNAKGKDGAPFSGAALHDQLQSIGQDRLKILFTPEELSKIEVLRQGAIAMTYAPRLNAVNNSNTTPAMLGQALRLANKVPMLNMITSPIAAQMETETTQKLLARALLTHGAENSARDAAQAETRKRLARFLTEGARPFGVALPAAAAGLDRN